MDEIYELANAIIMRACDDYRYAKCKLAKRPWSLISKWTIEDVERFIRSEWFGMLTDIDPEWLLSVLKSEKVE